MKQYARYNCEIKELSMNKDFDDFQDENAQIRQSYSDSLDRDQYGEYYDPNIESYYDLDVFSLDYAKSLFHALGNSAKYKGFNLEGHRCSQGVTSDCTKIEYSAFISQQLNHVNDEPLGLYHKNNQTILDPTSMPSSPVEPEEFVAKVKSELLSNNVFISDEMPDLLEQMCRLFNFSIHPSCEIPRSVKNLVFPAQTGIGKSVSVQVYVSMLEAYSSVIVVSKVEEAIKYCNYINKLSCDEFYARCYFPLTDKNKDDPMRVEANKLKDHRCIIITHNMFQRVNGFEDIESFSNYNGKPRDFVAIDEKLSFYDRYDIGYKELDKLISNVEEALEQSKTLSELDSSHEILELLKQFKEFLLFKSDMIVTNDSSVVTNDRLPKLVESTLKSIGESITYSSLSIPNQQTFKLVDLKDKNLVVEALRTSGIATQSRKRNVIGVSSKSIDDLFRTSLSKVDSFYSESFDPRFS